MSWYTILALNFYVFLPGWWLCLLHWFKRNCFCLIEAFLKTFCLRLWFINHQNNLTSLTIHLRFFTAHRKLWHYILRGPWKCCKNILKYIFSWKTIYLLRLYLMEYFHATLYTQLSLFPSANKQLWTCVNIFIWINVLPQIWFFHNS